MIRPSALGDVCRSVPVLVSLKRAWPDATVDWLVQDSFVDAITAHPDLHKAVPFPRAEFGRLARHGRFGSILRWLSALKHASYDLVLDCQGLGRSGLFAWATRAPQRIGWRDARELAWLGLTRRVEVPHESHTVDRMIALAEAAGAQPIHDLTLYPPAADRQWADRQPWIADSPLLIVGPTSRWPGKLWPAERFEQAMAAVLKSTPCTVLVVAGPGEGDQCSPVLRLARRHDRVIDLVGDTTIGQLMALVERASLILAHDSALLHMAVGLDRPAIGLYGPTDIARVGPYGRPHDVIQHVTPGDRLDHKNESVGRALMNRITVGEVVEAIESRLADTAAASPSRGSAQTPP